MQQTVVVAKYQDMFLNIDHGRKDSSTLYGMRCC